MLLAALPVVSNAQTYYSYLDDADRTLPPALASDQAIFNQPWPRLSLTEEKSLSLTDEQFAKYNMVSGKAFALAAIKRAKVLNPSLIYIRTMPPRAFQGFD